MPEQLYVLYRCIETATTDIGYRPDEEQHEGVKRFLAHLVGDRAASSSRPSRYCPTSICYPIDRSPSSSWSAAASPSVDQRREPASFALSPPR